MTQHAPSEADKSNIGSRDILVMLYAILLIQHTIDLSHLLAGIPLLVIAGIMLRGSKFKYARVAKCIYILSTVYFVFASNAVSIALAVISAYTMYQVVLLGKEKI